MAVNSVSIAICGSAAGKCDKQALKKSREIGKLIAKEGAIVLSGATSGYTYEAAKAAKDAGGLVIGISPAANREEHIKIYEKKIDAWTSIIYTVFGYKGRNVILTRSADAAIFIGGGTGTLSEFTMAFDEKRPIGILTGVRGTMELVDQIDKYRENYQAIGKAILELGHELTSRWMLDFQESFFQMPRHKWANHYRS